MADYYTDCCFEIKLTNPKEGWDKVDLIHREFSGILEDEDGNGFSYDKDGGAPIENRRGYLESQDGWTDVNNLVHFLQLLVVENLIEPVGFEWANHCNKQRTDAFGGGVAYVSKTETTIICTSDMLRLLEKEHALIEAERMQNEK